MSLAVAESVPLPRRAAAARPKRAVVADLFCGAGSLSMGINDALIELGYRPQFHAVNHWEVATQTYAANHPGAQVHCVTLDAAFPAQVVPGGRLDLLAAGIECTFFSRARGGKPVNDQQRMSAWHVVRWATELRTDRLLLENVPEFLEWGPVNPKTGKPLKSRRGEYFQAWIAALRAIGFKRIEWRVLNCADYGDATTRERLFILAWKWDRPLPWPAPSHSRRPNLFGEERWRAAREIIDWSIPGKSIFDRKRPLAPKTLARIAAGIVKFRWPEPFIVVLRQHADARGIDLPLPAVCAGGNHLGLAQPFVATVAHGNDAHERDPHSRRCRSADEPLQAIHAGGNKFALVEPFTLSPLSSGAPRSIADPLSAITQGGAGNVDRPGCARHMLIEGAVAANDDRPTFAEWYADTKDLGGSWQEYCKLYGDPPDLDSLPFVLSQHAGGAPRATEEPLPGMTNDGAHALIAPYYSNGSGQTCRSIDDPLPAATAKARFGLVMPVTHSDGSNRARDLEEPLPTLTTAARGELAFITAAFGERNGQAPRVHSVDDPSPTICAQGRVNLVTGSTREYDILFRMLEPHELAAAMSISEPGRPYRFVGNKTEVVRQIGQAVPRRTGRALARALMEAE